MFETIWQGRACQQKVATDEYVWFSQSNIMGI